jgi:hypothetical protein
MKVDMQSKQNNSSSHIRFLWKRHLVRIDEAFISFKRFQEEAAGMVPNNRTGQLIFCNS